MKLAIAKEHRDFFQKQGLIEFEAFLTPEQVVLFNQAVDQALAERFKMPVEKLRLLSSENLFLQGRDLWRSNEALRKLVCQPRFAEIASELIEKKPLRLGYDQLFPARYRMKAGLQLPKQSYTQFIEQSVSLETISCLQGILCGLMLNLGGTEPIASEEELSGEGINIFPQKPGQAIYFHPQTLINLKHLTVKPGQRFYLIVYTPLLSHYRLQPTDPHTHVLKQLGYVFNDKLVDRLHPIVYR